MITSKNTSINKTKVPALFKRVDSWGFSNLDLGGGKYDTATEYLLSKGCVNFIYDPYNRSEEENKLALMHNYATCTISNVLNVIQAPQDRENLLKLAYDHLQKGGKCFITVYEGNKSGVGSITKKDCWQENRLLSSYISEVEKYFTNVRISKGVIIAEKEA